MPTPPILAAKSYTAPSVFTAQNLLREARRQKLLSEVSAPRICVLDPDGDIVRYLIETQQAQLDQYWACYHTNLYSFTLANCQIGIIGCAVGASFAVLVAEELFASGCELLISITSAGQITALAEPPYFILIQQALRDEGTSYHYLPPAIFSAISPQLLQLLSGGFSDASRTVYTGATWTTDAPFRETSEAIQSARSKGVLAVEMEAAALYTFARAAHVPVLCLAHVTNTMGQTERDFEKGAMDGAAEALAVIEAIAGHYHARFPAARSV